MRKLGLRGLRDLIKSTLTVKRELGLCKDHKVHTTLPEKDTARGKLC